MKVLVAGFSPQSTAAVEIIVGSLWPSASFVKLARGATFAPPEQAPEAQQCDICVVDLLGLGMAIWAPEHEVELQAFLGDRRAVLFVPAGSDEGWPSALAALGPARVVLQHPASTAALREALATLRGDHRSDGESESGQEDISETVRGSDGQSAGPDVVTTGRQAESGSSTVGEGAADEAAESSVGAAATFQRDDLALENVVEPVSSASDSGEVAQWPTEGEPCPDRAVPRHPSVHDDQARTPQPDTESAAEPLTGSSSDALRGEESTLPLDITAYASRPAMTPLVFDPPRTLEMCDPNMVPTVVAVPKLPELSLDFAAVPKAGPESISGRGHRREEVPQGSAARVPSPALAALMSGVGAGTSATATETSRSATAKSVGVSADRGEIHHAARPIAESVSPGSDRRSNVFSVTGYSLDESAYTALLNACPDVARNPYLNLICNIVMRRSPSELRITTRTGAVFFPAENWVASNISTAFRKRLTQHEMMLQVVQVHQLAEEHAHDRAARLFGRRGDGPRSLDAFMWSLVFTTFEQSPPVSVGDLCFQVHRFPNFARLHKMPDLFLQLSQVCMRQPQSLSGLKRLFSKHDPNVVTLFVACALLSGVATVVQPSMATLGEADGRKQSVTQPSDRRRGLFKSILDKLF